MEYYPITTNIIEHNNESAEQLLGILENNSRDDVLKNVLNIDVTYIEFNAYSHGYITINDVHHHHDNIYTLVYTLDYHINNGCRDRNIDSETEISMNFEVYDDHLSFDVIDHSRDTLDEF